LLHRVDPSVIFAIVFKALEIFLTMGNFHAIHPVLKRLLRGVFLLKLGRHDLLHLRLLSLVDVRIAP
jgi:hypothetical protein